MMNIRQFEDGLLKVTFDAVNKQQTITIEIGNATATLDAATANDLLDWLYQQRDSLFQLAYMSPAEQAQETI